MDAPITELRTQTRIYFKMNADKTRIRLAHPRLSSLSSVFIRGYFIFFVLRWFQTNRITSSKEGT
jgi:hypothetical protein